jgi:poly(hydroxyalkanoate) granule-associated protein
MARSTRSKKQAPVRKVDAAQAIAFARTSARNAIKAAISTANEARDVAIARAGQAKAKTVDAVSQLEKVFEQRVSRAISRLGVPTTQDMRALSRQVARLQASVEGLRRSRARA